MSNKPKITYLLGAGASAFAVPTVKFFPVLLQKFKGDIEKKLHESGFSDFDIQTASEKLKIIDEISNFATVDTWARKLYLSNSNKYETLKEIISLFLIYCQFGSNEQIGQYLSDGNLLAKSRLFNLSETDKMQFNLMYQNTPDPRYDLFLGSILSRNSNNGMIQFPDNINVISWNYDSQFETSIKTFSNSNIYRENNSKFEIIKLNGSANFTIVDRKSNEPAFNFYYERERNQNYLDRILTILSNNSAPFKSFKNNLLFAWEMQNHFIAKVSDIISDTEIIIVIGYTFPSFNQEVERTIFSKVGKIKKVYYQIPENEYESLLERLIGTVYKGENKPNFKQIERTTIAYQNPVKFINIKDMNQFYIPNEFYL